MKTLIAVIILLTATQPLTAQNYSSVTYNIGDIPTSYNGYDGSCSGNYILQVQLPSSTDSTYTVTSVDISYTMGSLGSAQMADQRSQVYCFNTSQLEPAVYSGSGASPGNMNYSRSGISIANGSYLGGTTLSFQMRAWRMSEIIAGCNSSVSRVNAFSWTIKVYYSKNILPKNVGIGTNTPDLSAKLDVTSTNTGFLPPRMTLLQRNAIQNPAEGLMVYQTDSSKGYWYYNGINWITVLNSTSPINSLGKTTIVLSDTITNVQAQLKIAQELGTNTEEIDVIGCTNLTSLDLSMIKNIRKISINYNPNLISVNLSNLISAEGYTGGLEFIGNPLLTTLNLNSLKQITGGIGLYIYVCNIISALNLPALSKVTGDFLVTGNPLLTSVSFPSFRYFNSLPGGRVIDFSQNKLPSSQINYLLAKLVSVTPTITGTYIDLSRQLLSAPPTGQGIIDKNTLIANGNMSVTTD